MKIQTGRIDVHHHIIPPAFTATMDAKGLDKVAGAQLPKWTPEITIDQMDMVGIQTAIVSLSAPGVYFGNKQDAIDLARSCNEFAAEMRTKYPTRFGNFAVLPMPFTDLAIKEVEYALDTLKADGVVLLGSTEGQFLGDNRFDDLMAELDKRKATVFVHPNIHPTSDTLTIDAPGFIVEFLCDTTRAAVNLILTGTLEKYPNITWILSHAGGFLPYIAWRVSLANAIKDLSVNIPQGVLTYIKRFYFDTALSPSPMTQACLKELVDPSHVLFGSDFPFAPLPVSASQVKTLEESPIWDDTTKYGINRGHALRLFPQYKVDNEVVQAKPIIEGMSGKQKIRKSVFNGVVSLLDWVKDR